MPDTDATQRKIPPPGGLLLRGSVAAACLIACAALSLVIYLRGSHAPVQISRYLTEYLGQPVRVTSLDIRGGGVSLRGLAVINAPGFSGDICRVDSLTIVPDWGALLTGGRGLRSLAMAGVRIDLSKDGAGTWNFAHLQRVLASKPSSTRELRIGRFEVSGGTILVNGQGAKDVALRLSNLSTRGSREAGVTLSFEDVARNRYDLSGRVRPGKSPTLELALSAPSISPGAVAAALKLRDAGRFARSGAGLRMNVTMRDGIARLSGVMNFSHLPPLPDNGPERPLTGKLELAASYDMSADRARLESIVLSAGGLGSARGAATVEKVRSERRFSADLAIERLDLASLVLALPAPERAKTVISGALIGNGIHLDGDAGRGVTGVRGTLLVRNASLWRQGRPLFSGVDTTLTLGHGASGFLARGNLSRRGGGNNSFLESVDAPFVISISNRLQLVSVRVPSVTASFMGLAITGRFGLEPAAREPLSASVRVSSSSVARLAPLAEALDLKLEGGACLIEADASGRGIHDFSATAAIRLSSLLGTKRTMRFGLNNGRIDARITGAGGEFTVSGTTRLEGGKLGDRAGDVSFRYQGDGKSALLTDGVARFDGVSLRFARLIATLPGRQADKGVIRYPLSADLSGGVIQRDRGTVSGISAALRVGLLNDGKERWLEGTAETTTGQVAWQGKPAGAPWVRVSFSRKEGRGELGGGLLGGTLQGTFTFNPLAPREGGTFRLGIKGGQLARMVELLPRNGRVTLSGGPVDGTCGGDYSPAGGLTCRFNGSGNGISATGNGSKTLVSGAGFKVDGLFTRAKLTLDRLLLSAGPNVALTFKGTVHNPVSPKREGRLTFALPQTPVNSLIDSFVNALPRFIQESSADGSLSVDGGLTLRDGKQLLDGAVRFANALLDTPSQKFKVSGIDGTLPFSLDLAGGTLVQARETASFTRENYPHLLMRLRKPAAAGQIIRIAGVTFGPLNMGETTLTVSAEDGMTKISSFRSSLYEGALLGTGYIAVKKGLSYRGDLLVNGLSLKLFCASIPQITDYISGRVDGVISLNGEGGGVSGLTGFTELWAREGNGEKMLVSKVFLQKLSGKNLSGFFFRNDRAFDQAEISADLEDGFLTFESLDISHTNLFGVRDLSVSIAPSQNRIALDHLLNSIKQATVRGKAATGGATTNKPDTETEFKWQE